MTVRRVLLVSALIVVTVVIGTLLLREGAGLSVDAGRVERRTAFTSSVTGSGEIVAAQYADIGSSVMGKVVSLPVREGDVVAAGQVLARIDPVQAETQAAGAAAQVSALESDAAAATSQAEAARSDLTAAQAHALDASQVATRLEALFAQGIVPASEVEAARAALNVANAQVRAAEAAVERADAAGQAAARRVTQAGAEQRRTRDLLDKTSVVSPIDGVVTRLQVREGEMVVIGVQNQPGTTLMTISDLSALNAEVKVAEADVLRLAVGQQATVTLEAVQGQTFTGRVIEIGASALPVTGTGSSAREFRVVVRLDDTTSRLRSGLTCDADIVTSRKADVLTVPLQSVVLRAGADGAEQTGVFVIDDDVAVFTPVTPGIIGGLDIEVEGLSEGTPVVIGPYQVLRDLQHGDRLAVSSGGS